MGGQQSQHSRQNEKDKWPLTFMIRGLKNAGKSSIFFKMKYGDVDALVPTIGEESESFYYEGYYIHGWDYSGGRGHTGLSTRYVFERCSGIIFAIDSEDTGIIDEAFDELKESILKNERVEQAVVMVLANKQDLDKALSPLEIENKIKKLHKLGFGTTLSVMPCSAMTGEGVEAAYNFFFRQMMLMKEGKLKPGFIPRAWESTDKKLEKHNMVIEGTKLKEGKLHKMKKFKKHANFFKSLLSY